MMPVEEVRQPELVRLWHEDMYEYEEGEYGSWMGLLIGGHADDNRPWLWSDCEAGVCTEHTCDGPEAHER